MHEQSPLFARLRLMIAKFLMRDGDDPPFRGLSDAHARVRVPLRGGGPDRAAPRSPSTSPTRNRN